MRREGLEAQLEHLAALLAVESDGSKAASLSREMRALRLELDSLGANVKPKGAAKNVADLAAERASRRAGAAGSH